MDSEFQSYLRIAGGVLIVLASISPLIPWKSIDNELNSLLFTPVLMAIGFGLIDWRVGLSLVVLFGFFCLWIYCISVSNKRYERNFPVFKTPPIETVTSKDGFRYNLHIAKVSIGFIIGIHYEDEIDLTPMTFKTKWNIVFPDYASAQSELSKRLGMYLCPRCEFSSGRCVYCGWDGSKSVFRKMGASSLDLA
jgi:hypothetical protein